MTLVYPYHGGDFLFLKTVFFEFGGRIIFIAETCVCFVTMDL